MEQERVGGQRAGKHSNPQNRWLTEVSRNEMVRACSGAESRSSRMRKAPRCWSLLSKLQASNKRSDSGAAFCRSLTRFRPVQDHGFGAPKPFQPIDGTS